MRHDCRDVYESLIIELIPNLIHREGNLNYRDLGIFDV